MNYEQFKEKVAGLVATAEMPINLGIGSTASVEQGCRISSVF